MAASVPPHRGLGVTAGLDPTLARDIAANAEQLGYHSAYTTHLAGRDSLTVLATYAQETESIRVGTGVLPIYSVRIKIVGCGR